MKRLLSVMLACTIMAGTAVPGRAARIGQVVDYALHTDIVAQINGHPLRSYNVGGRTAVVAEDLKQYGFWASWDGAERTLRVERAMRLKLEPVDPWAYPDYTPGVLAAPIGSRAQAILSTDIQTYVAGEPVSSFNIDGETLIWFSDLDAYGQVVWDAERRTANLILGDPMQIGLERVLQPLLDWNEATNPEGEQENYQLYENEYGTLVVGWYRGTPHGTQCAMAYVKRNGNVVDVDGLMPVYGFGTYYLNPREVRLEYEMLEFVSPVRDESGAELGECLVRVDLNMGRLLSVQPLSQALEQWEVSVSPETPQARTQQLHVECVRRDAQVSLEKVEMPSGNIQLSMTPNQLQVIHYAALMWEEEYQNREYRTAQLALQSLAPWVSEENFSSHNSPELREKIAQYLCVSLNGEVLTGNSWWGQGNNHSDLCFEFDRPVLLEEGDVLSLWIGTKRD